jgi:tetratricopeptide (TPR) repeat protein
MGVILSGALAWNAPTRILRRLGERAVEGPVVVFTDSRQLTTGNRYPTFVTLSPRSAMKVFLSHSTKDKDFVQQLSAAIIGAGSETWLCEIDVQEHANFVVEIEKGLQWCEVALLIWSPAAAASKWTEEEWTSVLARQVVEQKTRLGIVLLRDHPLPELLRTKNYIDARANRQEGFRRTVAWLEHRESVKRFLGLPEYRPQDFVGRAVYLQQLRTSFSGEPMVYLLHGEPGAGKSTLALQFAWDAQKDFDAVVYQTCGHRPLDAITAELVDRLPIDVKTLPPDQQRKGAKDWLRQRESLLILDDVWPNDGKIEIREFEPGPTCSVLYTSRQKSLPGLVPKQTSKVEKFTDAEAEELFHTYLVEAFTKQEVDSNRKPLLDFAARVEMLPIAVAVGASLLREMSAIPLGEAVSELRVDTLNDGAKNVNNLFAQAIDSQRERERKLLDACAVCVQEGFWLPLAADIAGLSKEDANKAAVALVNGSLLRVLDRDRRRFQLHALLRDQLGTRVGTEGLDALLERHAMAVEELFKDWRTRWRDCRECLVETISAADRWHLRGEAARAQELAYAGYSAALRVGELDIALRIMQRQDNLAENRGDEHALQSIYGWQANVLYTWGRLDDAMILHKREEALALTLGNRDQLQRSYGNQALILKDRGRLEEAMALHKKEEAICQELGNIDGLQASYCNQALLLYQWGRLDEAMTLYKKQESICLELGNRHDLATCYGNQANILHDWGRLDEALALHTQEESIYLELGDQDGLQCSYGNQALILKDMGRLEEALNLHKKEEIICVEMANKNSLATSYGNQASILRSLGRAVDALELHKKEESLYLDTGSSDGLGYCYWGWGLAARNLGDRQTETHKLQEALAIFTSLKMPRERDAVQRDLTEPTPPTNKSEP